MRKEKKLLNEVAEVIEIKNINEIKKKESAEILKKAGEGELTHKHIAALIKNYPEYIKLQSRAIDVLIITANKAGESQKAALDSLKNSLTIIQNTISDLAKKTKSDKTRIEIGKLSIEAGEQAIKLGQIIAEINTNNNNFWIKIASIAGSILVAIAAVFVASHNKDEN